MKKLFTVLIALGCWLQSNAQENLPSNFFKKTLPNGLEVLVIEDANVPLATIEIVVKNGAYTEDSAFNGLSHLYEHMFFKANKTYPSQKAYLDRVNELGISFNGTTSDERVNYFCTLSKDKLTDGLQFMNDAIRYPLFLQDEMKTENPVVAGEFQRNESGPYFSLFYKMNQKVWGDNWYRKNAIGLYSTILSATPEKMTVIKDKYYYPNNSMLAISGDVDHNKVFAEAARILGDWKASDFDPFERYPIPEFKPLEYSSQFVIKSPIAKVPFLMQNYHGPDTRGDLKATYAADVFSYILQQQGSKLSQSLIETGLAYKVEVGYQTARRTGPISIVLVPNPAKTGEAIRELYKNMEQWDSDDYFTDEQLQTAKVNLEVSDAFSSEKPSDYIHTVTFWWASATVGYYTSYVENLKRVTREDIKNYVRKYIKGKNYVAGLALPERMAGSFDAKLFAETYDMKDYTLYFDNNEVAMTDSANAAKLISLRQWIKINPTVNIRVESYQDAAEGKTAGLTRYTEITKELLAAGYPEARIIGNTNKAFQVKKQKGVTDVEKKENRKVVFTIVKQ